MIKSIKAVKEIVRHILKWHIKTRDNDTLLYCIYLNKFHGLSDAIGRDNYRKLKKIMCKARTPESLTRARRLIQADGMLKGTRKRQRYEAEREVRKNINRI